MDEHGTEATTAAALTMTLGAGLTDVTVIADHPFLFMLRDGETGLAFFCGRLTQP